MLISGADIDKEQEQRVDGVFKLAKRSSSIDVQNFFVSERVANTILEEKALIGSLNIDKIKFYIPFYENIYVFVCPKCVRDSNIDEFKILLERGAIVPVLVAPYNRYDRGVVDMVSVRDHISYYEYQAYRWLQLVRGAEKVLCQHCVGGRKKEIIELISDLSDVKKFKRYINLVMSNMYPHAGPDFSMMDNIYEACREADLNKLISLVDLSDVIYKVRCAKALGAHLTMTDVDLEKVPMDFASSTNEAQAIGARVSQRVVDGLGLRVPADIPLDQYIEIAHDYRPRINGVIQKVRKNAGGADSWPRLARQVMGLNAEIERVKGLARYRFLEGSAEFAVKNPALVATALASGALGLAGGLVGCLGGAASGVATAGATKLAKKTGLVDGAVVEIGPKGRSFGRSAKLAIQPYLDELISKYTGAPALAINVLSLRNSIAAEQPTLGSRKRAEKLQRQPN